MRAQDLAAYLSIAGVITGCASGGLKHEGAASSADGPTVESAVQAGVPLDQANAARKLYVLKCAKCHQFYDPAKYEDGEWQLWMGKMRAKARLTSAEEQLLNTYIDAYRHVRQVRQVN